MFGGLTLTQILLLLISSVVALVIHEFMHGYVAYRLGDTTAAEYGRLSFNPLDHIDPFMTIILPVMTILIFHFPLLAAKPVPFDPSRLKFGDYGAAMVAAAGPLSNLVLAIIAGLFLHLSLGSFAITALAIFAQVNVAIFVFNLVPIPPLDGSRVVYAFAPEAVRRLFEQVEPIGLVIIFGLVLFHGFDVLVNIDQSILNNLP